jgi:UV DNA damage endonuclease
MKIGYPCMNRSLPCGGSKTFRLKSYSAERLRTTVANNLSCLDEMLRFNVEHRLLFFRLTSTLVPFASHAVNTFPWQEHFEEEFDRQGKYIKTHDLRISMHPDQFTLINSTDEEIFERSRRELEYHVDVLELLGLDPTAKIQMHVGGVYGDKANSMRRFIERYVCLDERITKRLVIENDDRSYTVSDCLRLHETAGVPVLFDNFHHEVNNSGEAVHEAVKKAAKTWQPRDGILMVDYSLQKKGGRAGAHADTIELPRFTQFIAATRGTDFDIMLEIKDKEQSALKAVAAARSDPRFKG